ncbi:MAG: hypothetical protein WBI40_09255 [Methylococcaceae bacterium]
MTTTSKLVQEAPTQLGTGSEFNSLANATYAVSAVKDSSTSKPLDVIVNVTVAASSGTLTNKQVVVFALASLDNTAWQSGVTSGSNALNEPDMTFLGTVPYNDAASAHTRNFSIYSAFGFVPKYFKIVLKNDTGVALAASSGATIYTSEITGTSV